MHAFSLGLLHFLCNPLFCRDLQTILRNLSLWACVCVCGRLRLRVAWQDPQWSKSTQPTLNKLHMTETRYKTYTKQSYPYGSYARTGHRLLCADGIIRAAKLSQCADTFSSIPASINHKGKHIVGFASCEEIDGQRVYTFHAMDAHKDRFPFSWPSMGTVEEQRERETLLRKGI